MLLEARENKRDTNAVEIWSSDQHSTYLAATMHIDNFTGPVLDRIQDGHPVSLHIEVEQPRAYKILELLADAGFDTLDEETQDSVMDEIEGFISDLANNGWRMI